MAETWDTAEASRPPLLLSPQDTTAQLTLVPVSFSRPLHGRGSEGSTENCCVGGVKDSADALGTDDSFSECKTFVGLDGETGREDVEREDLVGEIDGGGDDGEGVNKGGEESCRGGGKKGGQVKRIVSRDFPQQPVLDTPESDEALTVKQAILDISQEVEGGEVRQGDNDRFVSSSVTFSVSRRQHQHQQQQRQKQQQFCGVAPEPVPAVEVSVSGVPQTDHRGHPRASEPPGRSERMCKAWAPGFDSRPEGNVPVRWTNLSKSPISVITVSSGSLPCCTVTPKVTRQATLDGPSQATLEHDRDSVGRQACGNATRPPTRSRLSRTIQDLQEKLQQEMDRSRGQGSRAEAGEAKKLPARAGGERFTRERSRRRSKSRAAFKLFQRSRIFPSVSVKERPYRQWMGVGSCVTSDTRYIVSSGYGSQGGASSSEVSEKENNTPGITSADCRKEGHASVLGDAGASERKGDTGREKGFPLRPSNPNQTSTFERWDDSPAAFSDENEKVLKQTNQAPSRPETVCPADEPFISPTNKQINLHTKEADSCDISADTRSPTAHPDQAGRERSRVIKRAASGQDRQVRAPTPHSKHRGSSLPVGGPAASAEERTCVTPKPLSAEESIRTTSEPRASTEDRSNTPFGDTEAGQHRGALGVSREDFTASGVEGRPTPSAQGVKKRGHRSRSKFPVYGSMRTSKILAAAQKQQQKRPTCNDQRHGATGSDVKCHGSLETLWSDVSTITGESCDLSLLAMPSPRDVTPHRQAGSAHGTKKYVDVVAVADFKGFLPGQLSFNKGQIVKQLVCSSKDEMSYGYYRAGRFKRKRKGLFPSFFVVPSKSGL